MTELDIRWLAEQAGYTVVQTVAPLVSLGSLPRKKTAILFDQEHEPLKVPPSKEAYVEAYKLHEALRVSCPVATMELLGAMIVMGALESKHNVMRIGGTGEVI